jgi:hypothetical protein
MSSISSTFTNKNTLKPTSSLFSLNHDPKKQQMKIHKFQYFEKLNQVENSCNLIHKDLKQTKKHASQKILKDIQGLTASVHTFDERDDGWKVEIQKFREKREKNQQKYEIFKTFPADFNFPREPIKRMKAKNGILNSDAKKIEVSDADLCLGKQFLYLNRRNFGEITCKSYRNDLVDLGKHNSCFDKMSDGTTQPNSRKAVEIKSTLKKAKDVPKLVKQLKISKKK